MDIVCISSAYWDEPLWTNKQHVMSRLSKPARVLYVDPPLSCIGVLRYRKRIPRPWSRLFPALRKKEDGPAVLSFPILPLHRYGLIRKLNFFISRCFLKWGIKKLGLKNVVVWIYNPLLWQAAGTLVRALLCYDCVDDIAAFPVYKTMRARVRREEEELCRTADIVFTTSPRLFNDKKQWNRETCFVPNVADFQHFHQASQTGTIPEEIGTLPWPRLMFVGAVSTYKLDFHLLRYLAENRPAWQIILIGPVGDGEYETDLCGVDQMANIRLLGFKPYIRLPDYLRGADVLLLPYRLSEYTESMMPLKFHEFMATGKPIVCTRLPALKDYAELIDMAESSEAFLEAVDGALSNKKDEKRSLRVASARENDWEKRISTLLNHLQRKLDEKGSHEHRPG